MTEEEALIRAREAVAAGAHECVVEQYRNGSRDHEASVQAAKRVLLDLDKPLPVDRDLADLREVYNEIVRRADVERALPTFRAIIQRRIKETRA